MKYEKKVEVELQEYICLVKRIDGVVAQKSMEEELIRCKDCKWFVENDLLDGRTITLCRNDNYQSNPIPEGFCNYAKRKEE